MNQLSLAWKQRRYSSPSRKRSLKQGVGYRVRQGFHFLFVSETAGGGGGGGGGGGREAVGRGTLTSPT